MRKKALLSTALSAALLTGMLTGCGNGNDTDLTPTPQPTSTSAPQPTTGTQAPEPTKGEEAPEPTKAEENQPDDGNAPAYQSLLEIDHLDNPNVVLDHYWNPDGRDSFEMAAIRRYE